MQQVYEYTVIPAPARGEKVRGARTGVERFSYALLTEMNRMAAQGWEYVRAETLPCEERSGLTSRTTVYHNVLVFRRNLAPAHAGREGGERAVPDHPRRPAGTATDAPAPAVRAAPDAVPAAAAVSVAAPAVPPRLADTVVQQPQPGVEWQDDGLADDEDSAAPPPDSVANYDEPDFAPDSEPNTTAAAPPAFVPRAPLAARREDEPREPSIPREPSLSREQRGVFSGAMPSGTRLGPAER